MRDINEAALRREKQFAEELGVDAECHYDSEPLKLEFFSEGKSA